MAGGAGLHMEEDPTEALPGNNSEI